MEEDNQERRKKAREARKQGQDASALAASEGASKQREHLPGEGHIERVEIIRRAIKRKSGGTRSPQGEGRNPAESGCDVLV
jgi:hypothetical protein